MHVGQLTGPTRGPVHHAHKILKKLNIEGITPTLWAFKDGTWDITQMSDLSDTILAASRDRAWRQAGLRNRDNLLNIREGVNVEETLQFFTLAKTPGLRGRIRTILSDGAYTPWKSNLKHGGDHHCPYCHKPFADTDRLYYRCERVRQDPHPEARRILEIYDNTASAEHGQTPGQSGATIALELRGSTQRPHAPASEHANDLACRGLAPRARAFRPGASTGEGLHRRRL